MFFRRDYILRMIDMMGDFFRRIGDMLDRLEKVKRLNDECLQKCGMTLEAAQRLEPETLCEMLSDTPRLLMSELMYIKAETACDTQEEQESLLIASTVLLASLWEESLLCELRADRLAELTERIFAYLTPAEFLLCANFFEQAESYADMEDMLFEAAERAEPEEARAYAQTALEKMQKALSAPPEALILSGMTPSELRDSIVEIQTFLSEKPN